MVEDVAKSLLDQIKAAIDLADATGQTLVSALLSHALDALNGCATSQ